MKFLPERKKAETSKRNLGFLQILHCLFHRLVLPGSPEHTANASLYFEKGGLNVRLSYNHASSFIDEMGPSTFYDRFYDAVNYMDVNASYTFGRKVKMTFYAEANNLLNQPLRYYQGTKDRTMQAEYYGVKVNAGFKVSF